MSWAWGPDRDSARPPHALNLNFNVRVRCDVCHCQAVYIPVRLRNFDYEMRVNGSARRRGREGVNP